MLILSRKPSESVMIGDDIVVTLVAISPNQVRLGITAPKDIIVHREEVYNQIRKVQILPDKPSPSLIN